jgi:ABC-2 type transport system ATP-binding protein
MRALNVEHLVKAYGSRRALDGFGLQVERGEFVALLGPNGAGKSTLMQVLTGLFMPDQGRVEVLGVDMRVNAPQALAGLGVVFQQMALDLDLTVRANLSFHARLHGMASSDLQQRTAQCLSDVGLTDQDEAVVRTLSGGNRRKVELARALLHQPQLLLMDEATVGLDIASRQQLMQRVRALQKRDGVATLWATHLADEASQADRVVVLHQGQVRFDGSVQALLSLTGGSDVEAAFMALTDARKPST